MLLIETAVDRITGILESDRPIALVPLGGHPKPASWGHLKTGQL
jgi:hypothetical protein